ncbi:MAG: methionine adenosyltransferase [Planctomycetes bacterium]|nr:methionine adenosyltransferase [Planctomycetota bacterium]
MSERHLFTSESVFPGHPDKVADQISDAILDAMLTDDPNSRVACETLVSTGMACVAGEITTQTYVHIPDVVRDVVRSIGYVDPKMRFDCDSCAVLVTIDRQSPDIAQGVNETSTHEMGAGDQGMMFGYACNQTPELMPLPIQLSKRISEKAVQLRESGELKYLRPDGKCQVTVEYEGRKAVRVTTVVVSQQHTPDMNDKQAQLKKDIIEKMIKPVIPAELLDKNTVFHVNPTGRFEIGGPHGDSGLTGRKIIVDTYGGYAPHGGGAFSGKDPTKVDRSAALYSRYVAKNVVAAGLADECEIQVAYAIGVAEPVSVLVQTRGTGKVSDAKLSEIVRKHFNFKPKNIIDSLKLRRPIYRLTAGLGPFGRNLPEFTWEKTDKAEALKSELAAQAAVR